MRTDASGKLIKPTANEQQENVKNTRKTLKVLQHAATDKENLVGRAQRTGKDFIPKLLHSENSETGESKKKKFASKYVQTSTSSGIKIDINDLTSEAGPSENYWEIIAGRRRIALDETLEENLKLHEENESLKEENRTCKEMLDESRHLVEILTEMLNEPDTNNEENPAAEPNENDDANGDQDS